MKKNKPKKDNAINNKKSLSIEELEKEMKYIEEQEEKEKQKGVESSCKYALRKMEINLGINNFLRKAERRIRSTFNKKDKEIAKRLNELDEIMKGGIGDFMKMIEGEDDEFNEDLAFLNASKEKKDLLIKYVKDNDIK